MPSRASHLLIAFHIICTVHASQSGILGDVIAVLDPPRLPVDRLHVARPFRHLLAEVPAPAPAPVPSKKHKSHKRKRLRNWGVGFAGGLAGGILTGLISTTLFRILANCARHRYRSPYAPTIYSSLIKRTEDLAFLSDDAAVSALEKIGEGGSGEVYRAEIRGGALAVAVKRVMKRGPDGGDPESDDRRKLDRWMRQIKSEIDTVGHVRHRNLVSLLAHVPRPGCHYLLYEYMKNGSLHHALSRGLLNWPARLRVAAGAAAGLEYLHSHHSPRIIHRDLKTANILLGDSMEARIADFGLAKAVGDADTHVTASDGAGTLGYIAPEQHQLRRLTDKCDVYSFGVVLAVLVVGREPIDELFRSNEHPGLVRWLRAAAASPDPAAAIDPRLRVYVAVDEKDSADAVEEERQMLLVIKIALFCTADDPNDRPAARDVRAMLAQIYKE